MSQTIQFPGTMPFDITYLLGSSPYRSPFAAKTESFCKPVNPCARRQTLLWMLL